MLSHKREDFRGSLCLSKYQWARVSSQDAQVKIKLKMLSKYQEQWFLPNKSCFRFCHSFEKEIHRSGLVIGPSVV